MSEAAQPVGHAPRRALVTGASSGIGEAVARLLAAEGYRVALLARREAELARVESELEGSGHLVLPCDLTQPERIQTAFDRIAQEFGGLDLLVNNAGIGYRARVEELDPKILRRVFDTNVFALLLTCRAALPLLSRSDRAVVINVASVIGRRGVPGQAAYSASKSAICSIGEALRIEWADKTIAVCTLNPALTATGFFAAQVNHRDLPDPDLTRASPADRVAQRVLELDRHPRPETSLRWKWQVLGVLSVLCPKWADRILVRRLGGGWRAPRW